MTSTSTRADLKDGDFDTLRAIIHDKTGITIADGRKSMLYSRLRSRLRETNEPDFSAYIVRVSSDADEMQELINKVTTNKTYFHRTPRIWQHFRDVAVPEFRSAGPKRSMRVWSAASSTGEEAHTIGTYLEHVKRSNPEFDYTITGTDVSSRVIQVAEKGAYAEAAVKALRDEPELFDSYMQKSKDGTYSVIPSIKAKIKFRLHNLLKPLRGAGPFDTVFLRNVLIYFTPEDQETILANVHKVLEPHGVLYIGESESITRLKTHFEIEEPMVYRSTSSQSGGTT